MAHRHDDHNNNNDHYHHDNDNDNSIRRIVRILVRQRVLHAHNRSRDRINIPSGAEKSRTLLRLFFVTFSVFLSTY